MKAASAFLFLAIAHLGDTARAQDASADARSGIRVVGGGEAPVGKYNFTANLRRFRDGSSSCGGSLIAPQYVLTAAHCLTGIKPMYVAVGTHYNSGDSDGERIPLLSSTSHPSFNGTRNGFDIAILKLSRPSKYTPISLSKDFVGAGESVKLLGWGQTNATSASPSKVLKENNFVVRSNDECQAKLRTSSNFPGWVALPSHLCAGGEVGQSACFGDSGGPLVRAIPTGGVALVGDVSFGEPCAKGFPDVYGRVSAFRSFIDQNAKGHQWV